MDRSASMKMHLQLALLPLAALLGTGCFGRHSVEPTLFAAGVITGAVLAADHGHRDRQEPEYRPVYQPIYIVTNPQAAPPRAPVAEPPPPPPPPAPPPFDAKRARTALADVDVSKCRAEGAPRGYGHARVTFNPSGDISKVVIDEPAQLHAAAAKCVGDELGRATVPVFNGSLVTVGTTWFVP